MFWGCFSYYGIGPLKPVESMMNSEKYLDVLTKKVIPEMARKFPEGSGIFQQDLAPCHPYQSKSQKFYQFEQYFGVGLAWKLFRFKSN